MARRILPQSIAYALKMKPVIELLSFTATEEYLADNSLSSTPFRYISKVEGFVKGFQGFSVEDPSQGYYILVWESFARYEAAGKREDFPAFLVSLKSTIKDDLVLQHVDFDDDTTNAFSAPVTELSIVKPKEGKTQTDVDSIIASMKEAAPIIPGVHTPIVWGPFKQNPEKYAFVAGWDSIDAHMNALKVSPVDVLAHKLFETADVTVVHLALQSMK